MPEKAPQMGEVKDLGPRFRELSGIAIEGILEIARILFYQARMQEAIELLDSDLVRSLAAQLPPEVEVRIHLAKAEFMIYQAVFANAGHGAALDLLQEAEEAATALGEQKLLGDARCLIGFGTKFREMTANRTYEAAVPYAKRSLALREEIGDKRGIAESLFLLGLCHEYGTEATHDEVHEGIREAEVLYRRALGIAEQAGDKELLSSIARDLGWLCRRKGENGEAFELLKRSLRLREEIGFKVALSPAYHTMAIMHLERNEPDEALAYGREALRMATENGFERGRIVTFLPIGGALMMKGKPNEALTSYRKGLELAQAMNHQLAIEEFEKQIADLQQRTVQIDK
ncbi:tetratricopeptide repeat protein [Candidatus Bipolaricaulota bacterium]